MARYTYKTVGQLKNEYSELTKIAETFNRFKSYPCYKQLRMRCDNCIQKIVECNECMYLHTPIEGTCHICGDKFPERRYRCDKCKSYKKYEKCMNTRGYIKCENYLCSCDKHFCRLCSEENTKFCDICKVPYVYKEIYGCELHTVQICDDICCGKTFCLKQTINFIGNLSSVNEKIFCSEACKNKNTLTCRLCNLSWVEYNQTRNEGGFDTCDSCRYKYRDNHIFNQCHRCLEYKPVKYYKQRDRSGQEKVRLCIKCRDITLRRCMSCGCSLLLNHEFRFNRRVKWDADYYTFTDAYYTLCDGKYICTRKRCEIKVLDAFPFEMLKEISKNENLKASILKKCLGDINFDKVIDSPNFRKSLIKRIDKDIEMENDIKLNVETPEEVIEKVPEEVIEKVPEEVIEKVPEEVIEKVPEEVIVDNSIFSSIINLVTSLFGDKEENRSDRDNHTIIEFCIVCNKNPKEITFKPCNHRLYCRNCLENIIDPELRKICIECMEGVEWE